MTDKNFEQTLVLIKPDALKNSLTGYVLSQFSEFHTGLRFAAAKIVHVSEMLAEEHYAEHRGKVFFPALIGHIRGQAHYPDDPSKRRVIAFVYQGPGAIKQVRHFAGPTDPEEARIKRPGCIRALGTKVPVKVTWTATDAGTGVATTRLDRRTNTGAWTAQALGSAAAVTVTQALASGSTKYAYRDRATDGASNTSAYKTGPTFSVSLVQETANSVTWSGAWTKRGTPSASGGKLRSATAKNASATVTFTGRAVGWVSTAGPTQGAARVYIDGKLVATVDLTAGAPVAQQIVFARSWSAAVAHKLKVVCQATAGRPRIDVDAFVVIK